MTFQGRETERTRYGSEHIKRGKNKLTEGSSGLTVHEDLTEEVTYEQRLKHERVGHTEMCRKSISGRRNSQVRRS